VPYEPEPVAHRVRRRRTGSASFSATAGGELHAAAPAGVATAPAPSMGAGRADAGRARGRLRVSTARLVTGKLRLDADVRGEAIHSVAFALDAKPVLTKRRPPFGVELDLGRVPRLHSVRRGGLRRRRPRARARRAAAQRRPHRFALRLKEPITIPEGAERVTATRRARPAGGRTARARRVLRQQAASTPRSTNPVRASLPVPRDPGVLDPAVGYLVAAAPRRTCVWSARATTRAQSTSTSSSSTLRSSTAAGRTIEDVRPDEVQLLEAARSRRSSASELQRDLPITPALLIDTSASMAEELAETERAALRFFEEVLSDRDRAAVITFAEEPRLAARFTRSVEVLAGALAGLEPEGETKLWDALAFTSTISAASAASARS